MGECQEVQAFRGIHSCTCIMASLPFPLVGLTKEGSLEVLLPTPSLMPCQITAMLGHPVLVRRQVPSHVTPLHQFFLPPSILPHTTPPSSLPHSPHPVPLQPHSSSASCLLHSFLFHLCHISCFIPATPSPSLHSTYLHFIPFSVESRFQPTQQCLGQIPGNKGSCSPLLLADEETQRVACNSLQNMARENDLRRVIPESQMKRTAVTPAGTVLRTLILLNSLMR